MMKKALLGILFTLLALAFKPENNHRIVARVLPKDTIMTLNGYSQTEAAKLVAYCDTTKDTNPVNAQVWFNKKTINEIYNLLKADTQYGRYNPDGIRIYFSRTLAGPLHLNNNVVVVSTYQDGTTINSNGVKVTVHRDYFVHPDTASLFNLKDIAGDVSHYSDTTYGALLYGSFKGAMAPCQETLSGHEIPRVKAQKMVKRFHRKLFRTGKINSKSEWFDIGLLQSLVNELGSVNSEYDGIRIYFSRGYERNRNKNQVRLIFVATKAVKYGDIVIHKDQFSCDPASKMKILSNLDDTVNDNGELCPVNCTGASLIVGD